MQQTNIGHDISLHETFGTPQRNSLHPIQNIQVQEKRSLDAFRVFITHACEVLGLWKILCEHQFHIIADTISKVRL